MTRHLLWLPLTLFSLHLFAQPTFYIQKGSIISKVEQGDPEEIKASEWQVRLYKKGATPAGNSYWSIIYGNSAKKVMNVLKTLQDFELDYNEFMGKGRTEDPVYTNFNPLGPIAIIEKSSPGDIPLKNSWDKINEEYEKVGTYKELYDESSEQLKGIFEPEREKNSNPFNNYGDVFKEYAEQLKEVFSQLNALRKILNHSADENVARITKAVDENLNKLEQNAKTLRNISTTDAIAQTLEKELAKNTAKTNPSPNGNAYFIFLTADISIAPKQSLFSNLQTPKHLHVISKPIWYTQNQTDESLIKEKFLRAIENQVQNLDHDFYKNFSKNNYEAVGYINTNFKESRPLLNTEQYQEALINYKRLILNIDNKAEFFQLQ